MGEPAERPALVGRRLGEFEILEHIAGGGFGDVYRARQRGLDRDAVIKVLVGEPTGTAHDRFIREAQLASKLDHPYAAHVYAYGTEPDGLQWIAMELVRGATIAELLETQGPVPIARFLPLFEAVCQVVHAAHDQGIVHRDIKPANVMVVARSGVLLPKLLDLGVARIYAGDDAATSAREIDERLDRLLAAAAGLDRAVDQPPGDSADAAPISDTVRLDPFDHELHAVFGSRYAEVVSKPRDDTALTSGAVYLGSPPYMAPELWLGPHAAGPACDLYALGVLAFQCLTGELPFTGDRVLVIARAHLAEPVPLLPPTIPAGVHAVLARAMAKRPAERYPDALAMARALSDACRAGTDAPALARPSGDLIAAILARAPQPIAELFAAAEASPRAGDARARYGEVAALVAHYVGVLGLASWCRIGRPDAAEVRAAVRRLARSGLTPIEWLDLATAVTAPFVAIRDAFPLPELVDACHGDARAAARLRGVLAAIEAAPAAPHRVPPTPAEDAAALADLVNELGTALTGMLELFEYDLAVKTARGVESWIGPRRKPRPVIDAVVDAPDGAAVVLDRHHAPLVALWPIARAIAPTLVADPELFLIGGPGRYGHRLVAMPTGFERQDPDLAAWLEQVTGDATQPGVDTGDDRAPYRGLASFSVDDSEFFFGREHESEQLANHLRARPFAAVVGPSGAGKSSFVQAGVLPLLPVDWRAVVMRPGADPFAALADKLAAAGYDTAEIRAGGPRTMRMAGLDRAARARGETLVLLIDQAEELVTLCRDDAERAAFAELLAAVRDDDRVRVVLTLRDDFLMRLQRLPGLGARLTTGMHLLGTPSRTDLRRILIEPARRVGYDFEDAALVDEMVGAVADNPSALALLSFTAAQLWELRDRQFRKLRRKVYTSIGGVGGALAQHAEDVIAELGAEQRDLVREAFRHLVTADGTRAVIAKSELIELLGGGPAASKVIETLVQARLAVTTDAATGVTVEITHEALLESWPRLAAWRREDAESARLRDQLRAGARQWDARGRQRGLLWRGDAWTEYRLWRTRYRGRLTELEEAFAAACGREHVRSRTRRRVVLSAAFAILTATAAVLYVFATRARASAAHARAKTIELLAEQGRRDLGDDHPVRAAAALARAYELGGRQPALRFLLARALATVDGQGTVLRGHTDVVRAAMVDADGARIVTASSDKTLRLWDATTGAELKSVAGSARFARTADRTRLAVAAAGAVSERASADLAEVATWPLGADVKPTAIAMSDDGKRVVVGDTAGGVHALALGDRRDHVTTEHAGVVYVAAVSPDGAAWATGGDKGAVVLVHGADAPTRLANGDGRIAALAFDRAGQRLAAAGDDGTIRLWSVGSASLIATLPGHTQTVRALAFAPDGEHLASASEDSTVRLWRIATGAAVVLAGHDGAVYAIRFTDDGRELISGGADATVRVWDVAAAAPVAALDAHGAEVWTVDVDAPGNRVVSASYDHTARIWTIPRFEHAVVPRGSPAARAGVAARADRVIVAGVDGTARVVGGDGAAIAALPGTEPLVAAALSPDGTIAVTGSEAGTLAVWDVAAARVIAHAGPVTDGIDCARFSPDGAQIIAGGGDGVVRVLDGRSGAAVRTLTGHTAPVWGCAYSRDGRTIATSSDDKTIRLWDAATGATVRTIGPLAAEVNAVAFDAAGTRIAAVGADGQLAVFRAADGAPLGTAAAHHDNAIGVVFSADGARVITASSDRTCAVWDADTLHELARLRRHADAVVGVDRAADGDRVIAADADGAVWAIDLGVEVGDVAALSRAVRAR